MATSAPVDPSLSPDVAWQIKTWRWRVFAATWLSYAGLYMCRKPFYVVKSALTEELGFDATTLGAIGTAYLVAYTVGQFIAGAAGNTWGPRLLLLLGMGVSAAVNVGFGFGNSTATFMVLMVLNGLAQATGWSGNVGTMASWFRREERGRVMGWWATCYQVGGVVASGLAAALLGALGYRYAFFGGAAALMLVWLFFLGNQRNKPEDLGLPEIKSEEEGEAAAPASGAVGWSRAAVINILLVGVFYFFVKFIRYALWSWAPYFLDINFGLEGDEAGFVSTTFDFCGIAGVVAAGYLSDKLFGSRRAGISLIFMLMMTLSCLVLYWVGGSSPWMFAVIIGVIGFTLYGPDALMTGAGAMDLGSKRGATLAAGIINGMGSIGAVVQELVIGGLYDSGGGDLGPIFLLLMGAAASASVVIGLVQVRNAMGISKV